MYCPKCGITIGEIGNFCARCGKDVAYLREKDAAQEPLTPKPAGDDADQADAAADDALGSPLEKRYEPKAKTAEMFYCSYCGTMVFGEDNFCYECSKALQKKYYQQQKKKSKYKLWTVLSIIFVVALVVSYRFFGFSLHAR